MDEVNSQRRKGRWVGDIEGAAEVVGNSSIVWVGAERDQRRLIAIAVTELCGPRRPCGVVVAE